MGAGSGPPTARPARPWPLCGREGEVRQAASRLAEPGAVLIVGAAGIGKSRLASAIAEAVKHADEPARRVIATAAGASVPLGAFSALLRDVHEGPTWSLVRAATILRGGLLVVDDAHLLDAASAALVQHLACDGATRLVVTLRSGEPAPDAITSLWKDLGGERLELLPLSTEATEQLLEAVLDGPLVPGSAAQVHELTGGNPLHIRETVLAGLASGQLVRSRGVWRLDGRPDSGPRLRELIAARIANLSADELDGLRLFAFAEELPYEAAARLSTASTLAALERAGLVAVDLPSRTVDVAHPIHREVVRSDTPPVESMVVHDRLLEVGDAVEPIRRVLWWLRSTRSNPIGAELVLDAAGRAWRQMTPDLALTLLDAMPSTHAADPRARLLRASSLVDVHRSADAVDDFAVAFDLVSSDEDRARAAAGWIGSLLEGRGDADAAARALAVAEERIEDQDALDLVRARYVGSLVQAGRRADPDLVRRLSSHADPRVRLYAYQAASVMWLDDGGVHDGLADVYALLEPAMAVVDEIPRAPEWVFTGLITNHMVEGDLDEVAALLAAGRATPTAEPDVLAGLDVLEGRLQLIRGDVASALAHATRALAVMDRVMPDNTYVTWALSVQAAAAALLGDDALAAEACAEADAQEAGIASAVAMDARRERTKVRAGIDRLGTARALVELGAVCRDEGHRVSEFFCLYDATTLVPQPEVDRRVLQLAAPMRGRWAEIATARLLARRDRDADGIERAALAYEEMGARLAAINALAEAEDLHRATGRRQRADRARSRALRIAEHCQGARLPLLAGSVPRRELTRREHEVAALAATGLTSTEIADRLFVSRRTVDNQLSRIYAKLGVSGRAELPDALA